VLRNLAVNSAKAGATKVQLLDSANEMVRDRASSFILGLAEISPEAAGAAGGAGGRRGPGWVIDLSEPPAAPGLVIHVHHAAPTPAADAAGIVIDVTPNDAPRANPAAAGGKLLMP
jgi:hypothetical protein